MLSRGSASPSSTGAAKAMATSSTRRRSARNTVVSLVTVGGPVGAKLGQGVVGVQGESPGREGVPREPSSELYTR